MLDLTRKAKEAQQLVNMANRQLHQLGALNSQGHLNYPLEYYEPSIWKAKVKELLRIRESNQKFIKDYNKLKNI